MMTMIIPANSRPKLIGPIENEKNPALHDSKKLKAPT
jgi:hypothetical protein